jgi:voltage-gated potassium channel
MKKKAPKRKGTVRTLEDALENPKSPFFVYVNDLLALATVVSVLAIVLETIPTFSAYHSVFKVIEYAATALFTLEYLLRLHMTKRKLRYVTSFFGIIDLIAIIPTYLGLGNFTFLKSARALRIVRLLRIIRLAKLSKLKKKEGTSSLYTLNIQIYAITLLTAVLVLGTLFYLFEGHQAYAESIPAGMYWVFKAIVGGITYPQPITTGGTVVLILARFSSMILLGLMMSLVGTIMRKLLIGSEKDS